MALPSTDTIVTYPTGTTTGTATVLHVEPLAPTDDEEDVGAKFAVLLDSTPFHPVDAAWPDQPADRGTLEWNGGESAIVDCVVVATDGESFHLGKDIPVRKGTDGWAFLVAHLVTEAPPVGIVVTVDVDEKYRKAVSIGHTGCHLASLALNRTMAGRWSKEVRPDALGAPNFDAEANDTSRILERGSLDTYRLGKSLRKKGFSTQGLAEALPALETAVNTSLTDWVAENAPVRIDCEGDRLTDRRHWVCGLAEGEARIACGGTHATRLDQLGSLRAILTLEDVDGTPVLTMRTVQS